MLTDVMIMRSCQEIFPNLNWEEAANYIEGVQHGKLRGSLENCAQFLEVAIIAGGIMGATAYLDLYLGEANGFQVGIMRSDAIDLGKVDPAFDLCSALKQFQRRIKLLHRLGLIFASSERIAHIVHEDLVMWQHTFDDTEEGMI